MKVTIELTPEQISQIAAEISGKPDVGQPRDINEVFPRLGLAGEAPVQHIGTVEFGDDEERTYILPTADVEGARIMLSLGSPSSTLASAMALHNGAGIFVETMSGEPLTVAPNRTDVILSDEPYRVSRYNFGDGNVWNNVSASEPRRAVPGEPLILCLVRGRKLNDRGLVTFSYRSR